MRQIAWYVTIVLATITGMIVLWQFRQPLLLFLLSLATAAAFRPLIDTFTRFRLRRSISLLLSYLILLSLTGAILWVTSGPLLRDIEQGTNHFAISYDAILAKWPKSDIPFQRTLAGLLPPPEEIFGGVVGKEGFQGLMGVTTGLVGFFSSVGLILILSLYWSADSIHFERLLLSLIAVGKRPTARMIWRSIEKGIGAYIRSELFQSVLAGLMLWVGYRLIGLDYPVLLAVFGSLAWLIPWFGAVIAILPALFVGLTSGLLPGILAAIYTVFVLVVMEFIIEPRIFWRRNYSPVILILVILVLAEAYGLLGLILAPLVSASIQIVFKYLLHPDTSYEAPDLAPDEDIASLTSSLRERLTETKDSILAQSETLSPEIMNLLRRLESLVNDASHHLEGDASVKKPASR